MNITIKDVAREAGVSISTVSKVLNNGSSISDATKEHVRNIMDELGYQPNEQARNFARKKTNHIIYIVLLEEHIAFKNPHMFEIMCGVQNALSKKMYNLSFLGVASGEALSRIQDITGRKSADGIIVHGSVTTREIAEYLSASGFPHIIIGRPPFKCTACWIDINNSISGEMAAKHLTECGCRKIAFIGGPKGDEISTKRLNGFMSAMYNIGCRVSGKYIKYGDNSKESGYRLAMELFEETEQPDGIICENNYITLGVVKAMNTIKKRIPEDIGLISFDDYPLSRIIEPCLTVVDIDVYDMGYQAGNILLRKIKNPELNVQSYTTLPRIIVRNSTGKRTM